MELKTELKIETNEIVDEINSTLKDEMESFMESRKKWRSVGVCMETWSKIMLGTTSILA